MHQADSEEEACRAARAALLKEIDLEDASFIEVGEITESDCWSRVPAEWSMGRIAEYVQSMGVCPDDVCVSRPGQHPGLPNKAWLSVIPTGGHVVAAWLAN